MDGKVCLKWNGGAAHGIVGCVSLTFDDDTTILDFENIGVPIAFPSNLSKHDMLGTRAEADEQNLVVGHGETEHRHEGRIFDLVAIEIALDIDARFGDLSFAGVLDILEDATVDMEYGRCPSDGVFIAEKHIIGLIVFHGLAINQNADCDTHQKTAEEHLHDAVI